LGSNYNFNFNQLTGRPRRNAFYFNGNADVSGNLAGLMISKNSVGSKNLFGAPFSQYAKLEADIRYYRKLSSSLNSPKVWANRLIIGAGFPYGNSREIPFIKQFFIGGNNSLRGFRSRSVGPGTYLPPGYGTASFIPDQSGDIKIEFNSEVRAKLFSIVHGALFFDAGNIWLKHENIYKPGSKFSNNFLKEIAADVGVGIRFDVSILVLCFDIAIPVRKPFLPEGERWVWDEINFTSKTWRKENIIYNLGIGYPF
jgi:outer membrane protein assembly factor BamA